MQHTAQDPSRQIAYAAGCRAGMDPPKPFVVPDDYRLFAEDWKQGYRDMCIATGIHPQPEIKQSRAVKSKKTSPTPIVKVSETVHSPVAVPQIRPMMPILDASYS